MDGGRRWDIVQRIAAILVIVAGILLSLVVLTFAVGFFVWSISPGRDMAPVFWAIMPMFLAVICCLIAVILVIVALNGRKPRLMFPIAAGLFALAAVLILTLLKGAGNAGAETLIRRLATCAVTLALLTPWWRSLAR